MQQIQLKLVRTGGIRDPQQTQQQPQSFWLLDGVHRLGRGDPNMAMQVESPLASRTHCEFKVRRTSVQITDLKSRNGTYLNGKRILRSAPIGLNDLIGIGHDFTDPHRLRESPEFLVFRVVGETLTVSEPMELSDDEEDEEAEVVELEVSGIISLDSDDEIDSEEELSSSLDIDDNEVNDDSEEEQEEEEEEDDSEEDQEEEEEEEQQNSADEDELADSEEEQEERQNSSIINLDSDEEMDEA